MVKHRKKQNETKGNEAILCERILNAATAGTMLTDCINCNQTDMKNDHVRMHLLVE